MPINDATLEYLDFQLEQEKGKILNGGSEINLRVCQTTEDNMNKRLKTL